MAVNDTRKVVRFSWESLQLLCEWKDCKIMETSVQLYMKHICSNHLSNLSELELQCQWKDCEYLSKSVPELRRHVFYHAFHTKIKCLGKNFLVRKKLSSCLMGSHNRNVIPDLPEPFMCCWQDCREVFESPDLFYSHIDSHTLESSYVQSTLENKPAISCLWTGCKSSFSNQYKLKDHSKCHTQEKVIACPTCGGMFASRTKLLDHITRQKPVEKDEAYVCEYCFMEWGTERLLRDHMAHHVNHYKCPCCEMTCPTPSALRVHIDYRHCDAKPHPCEYCDYSAKKQSDLRKHLVTHSIAPPFICQEEGCTFTCRTQPKFRAHILTEHKMKKSKKYSCHLCSKVTARGNYLTKHLISKHNYCWPSGHYRFRYHEQSDGFFRLQTVRYETSELSEVVLCDNEEKMDDVDDPSPESTDSSEIHLEESVEDANAKPVLSNEEQILSVNSSVSGVPIVMYMQNGNTNEPVTAVLSDAAPDRKDTTMQSTTNNQGFTVVQIVDADGNSISLSDDSIFLPSSMESSFQNSQTIQIIEKDINGDI